MRRHGTAFRGVLDARLMITSENPRLRKHDVRSGDPECQVQLATRDGTLDGIHVARGIGAGRDDGDKRLSGILCKSHPIRLKEVNGVA